MTYSPAVLIGAALALVSLVSVMVSAVFWLAVRPSEDKVRGIVNESLNAVREDMREMRGDIKKLLERR